MRNLKKNTFTFLKITIYILLFLIFLQNIFAQEKHFQKPASGTILNEKEIKKTVIKKPVENKKYSPVELDTKQNILLNESFENPTFPPTGWSSVVIAGSPNWIRVENSARTGIAAAYSEFGPSGITSSRYLITKRIPVVVTYQYRLTFWIKREFINVFDPDTVYIKISNTDSLYSSFNTTLYKCYTGNIADTIINPSIYTTNYRQFTTIFTGFSGYVWIAFDHQDDDGQGVFLDDIRIEEIVNNDIGPLAVTNPSHNTRKNYNEPFTPKAVFKNFGLQTQSNIQVLYQIISPLQTIIYNNFQTISSLMPNSTTEVSFNNFTPYMYGIHKARIISRHTGDQNPYNDTLQTEFLVPFNISGTRTVGPGGDHESIQDALQFLQDNNIAGQLTFLLTNNFYNEPPLSIGKLHYTSATYPVEIKPSSGISAIINISATGAFQYGIKFDETNNFILNGSSGSSSSSKSEARNLTINLDTLGYYAPAIYIINGGSNLKIKNLNIKGYSKTDMSANTVIVIDSIGNNKNFENIEFDNLHLMRAFNGFFFNGPSSKVKNITISNCDFGGDGIDAITQAGIVTYRTDSLKIQLNNIQRISRHFGVISLYGIYLGTGSTNPIVHSNLIHYIKNYRNGNNAFGITVDIGQNSNLLCYNNMIYSINATGAGDNQNLSFAIQSINSENINDRFYYNSIYLSGYDSSLHANSYSAGFKFTNGSKNFGLLNNIVYNDMIIMGNSPFNKAYCIYIPEVNWPLGSLSNYNDFYTPSVSGVIGYINSVNRTNLNDWRTATGQDLNSISVDPIFTSGENLHIQPFGIVSPVDGAGIPISGITKDIDNENRNLTTPDIGADEFTPSGGISGQVHTGWNIVSLPVKTNDPRVRSIFPTSISSAFMFQNGYIAKDTILTGVGYWLKFPSAQTVGISGQTILNDTINVVQGWNMIGSISFEINTANITSLPPSIINSSFYLFSSGYQAANTLKPFQGYWVKVTQAGKLILKYP